MPKHAEAAGTLPFVVGCAKARNLLLSPGSVQPMVVHILALPFVVYLLLGPQCVGRRFACALCCVLGRGRGGKGRVG